MGLLNSKLILTLLFILLIAAAGLAIFGKQLTPSTNKTSTSTSSSTPSSTTSTSKVNSVSIDSQTSLNYVVISSATITSSNGGFLGIAKLKADNSFEGWVAITSHLDAGDYQNLSIAYIPLKSRNNVELKAGDKLIAYVYSASSTSAKIFGSGDQILATSQIFTLK